MTVSSLLRAKEASPVGGLPLNKLTILWPLGLRGTRWEQSWSMASHLFLCGTRRSVLCAESNAISLGCPDFRTQRYTSFPKIRPCLWCTPVWHPDVASGAPPPEDAVLRTDTDSPGHPGGSSTVHNCLSGNHLAAFLLSLWTGWQMNSNFWLSPTKPPLTELSSFSVLLAGQWLTFGRTCGDRLAEGRLTLKAGPHSRASPNSFLSLSCRMAGLREFLGVLLSVHSYLIRRRFPVLRLALEVSLSSPVAKVSLSPSTPAFFFFCKDCSHLRLWFFFIFLFVSFSVFSSAPAHSILLTPKQPFLYASRSRFPGIWLSAYR